MGRKKENTHFRSKMMALDVSMCADILKTVAIEELSKFEKIGHCIVLKTEWKYSISRNSGRIVRSGFGIS